MTSAAAFAQSFRWSSQPCEKGAVVLAALVLLTAQQPGNAATQSASQVRWRLAQAESSQPTPALSQPAPPPSAQPNAAPSPPSAAAQAPRNDDKTSEEKTSVQATVVDGEQLESLLGVEALSPTAEDMGRITDIIVDRTGRVRAAIIDFGGFLGVGSRKIAVDWRSLHFEPKKAGAVLVDLTKDQLRVAPVYKAAEPVVMIGGPAAKP